MSYPKSSLLNALRRLECAAKYGMDMRSSRDVCVDDAISLIREALDPKHGGLPHDAEVLARGALACLQQNAHFDADIRWASTWTRDAIVVCDHDKSA